MFVRIGITHGKYAINRRGDVKRVKTGKIIKSHINNKGYRYIDLCIAGKVKKYLIHRLVAMTFLPKKKGCNIVNHKDCNPLNCHVNNLEWCNYSYNNKYGYDMGNKPLTQKQLSARRKPKIHLHKPIAQYELSGRLVAKYKSVTEAANKNGYNISALANCAKGVSKTSYGYIWKYISVTTRAEARRVKAR